MFTKLKIAVSSRNKIQQRILLLENGANVNWQDRNDETPLIRAAHYGRIYVMELLLYHGTDPSIKDKYGQAARVNKSEEAIRLLEKY